MSTSTSASSWVPKSLLRFYSQFPLVLLPPDEEVRFDGDDDDADDQQTRRPKEGQASLWVAPASASCDAWNSSDVAVSGNYPSPTPACLRHQLLILFRPSAAQGPRRIRFRTWTAPPDRSVPGGRLPVLHVGGGGEVLPSDQVRAWLDKEHPLAEDVKR